MLDHHELARFPDGEHLIISQPYSSAVDTFDEELAQWQETVPGIAARNGGRNRSWYYPESSALLIVVKPEALDRVNLDFEISRATAPTGCVCWRD